MTEGKMKSENWYRRMHVQCEACDGTGAFKPDCWLCKGRLFVTVRKAKRNGFVDSDLSDIENGECYCPSCDGSTCDTCDGSGSVPVYIQAQQRDRVLSCALTGEIPPLVRSFHPRSRTNLDRDALLSVKAGAALDKAGIVFWYRDIFGDRLSVREGREAEARAAHIRHQLRIAQATP